MFLFFNPTFFSLFFYYLPKIFSLIWVLWELLFFLLILVLLVSDHLLKLFSQFKYSYFVINIFVLLYLWLQWSFSIFKHLYIYVMYFHFLLFYINKSIFYVYFVLIQWRLLQNNWLPSKKNVHRFILYMNIKQYELF